MLQFNSRLFAITIGAALAAGGAPLQAALIDYSFAGTVGSEFGLTGYNGETFSASATVDTTLDSIVSFSFSVTNQGTWIGSGGSIFKNLGAGTFSLDAGVDEGASYSQTHAGFIPLNAILANFSGPISGGGYSGLIDGYPTSFDFGVLSSTFSIQKDGQNFSGGVTSASGSPAAAAPVPATIGLALTGLGMIGGLGGLRRRNRAQ